MSAAAFDEEDASFSQEKMLLQKDESKKGRKRKMILSGLAAMFVGAALVAVVLNNNNNSNLPGQQVASMDTVTTATSDEGTDVDEAEQEAPVIGSRKLLSAQGEEVPPRIFSLRSSSESTDQLNSNFHVMEPEEDASQVFSSSLFEKIVKGLAVVGDNETNPEIPIGLPPGHARRESVASLHVAPKSRKREGCYLVKLRRGSGASLVRQLRKFLTLGKPTHDHREFLAGMEGFSVCGMDRQGVQQMLEHPLVDFVEEDAIVTASVEWGLDRIDQRNLPLDNVYNTNGVTGEGVDVYVVDSGIHSTHSEFDGRVVGGKSFLGTDYNDCDGHGTHVAGTIGGKTVGVAPGVNLFAVRVLDCDGSGAISSVVAGLDWISTNVRPDKKSVVNLSLGGGPSSALDNAVRSLIAAGIVVVIAGGNDGADACNSSPSRVAEAITVGASSSSDALSSWSNRGPCVDIIAPGSNIHSAWFTSDTAYETMSGTSMATPHVVGAVALYLSIHQSATPDDVANDLVTAAISNILGGVPDSTVNKLLNIQALITTATAAAAETVAATAPPQIGSPIATTASSGGGMPPPSGVEPCIGNLCEIGNVEDWSSTFHPISKGGYYCTTSSEVATHRAILKPLAQTAAAGVDLDLYLWRWSEPAGKWLVKDSSTSFGSEEEIRFASSLGPGCWSWEVYSYYGGGGYSLDMTLPE